MEESLMGGRGGKSGFSGNTNKATANGASTLPDLSENLGGRIRIFHDMMNDQSARGDNDVRFTGDMHEAPASPLGYSVPGTYEILKTGYVIGRESGEITAFNGRLYGVKYNAEAETYTVTDLRTGMMLWSDDDSIYGAWNTILTFNDGLHREKMKKSLADAEDRFRKAHH